MSDAFIMRSGGGSGYACIGVSYPVGSVCTCTDGTVTLRARDTAGAYVFAVPSAGTWTVSSTGGGKTASKTVTVYKNQAVPVELVYALPLYDAGNEYTALTGGWEFEHGSNGVGEKEDDYIYLGYSGSAARDDSVHTVNRIPLSDYSTLCADIEKLNGTRFTLGLSSVEDSFEDFIASTAVTKNGRSTVTVNISEISGSVYVKAYADVCNAMIYKVWLE